jgi:hypothetical protein
VVSLVATPDAGYRFVRWIGNVRTIGNRTAANTTITMLGNYRIRAIFVPTPRHRLTISSTPGGNVTILGEGTFTYDAGTVVSLVATPDAGYRFVKWTAPAGIISCIGN